jgi:hypothetical protein
MRFNTITGIQIPAEILAQRRQLHFIPSLFIQYFCTESSKTIGTVKRENIYISVRFFGWEKMTLSQMFRMEFSGF